MNSLPFLQQRLAAFVDLSKQATHVGTFDSGAAHQLGIAMGSAPIHCNWLKRFDHSPRVTPGLEPGVQAEAASVTRAVATWMRGSSPRMTRYEGGQRGARRSRQAFSRSPCKQIDFRLPGASDMDMRRLMVEHVDHKSKAVRDGRRPFAKNLSVGFMAAKSAQG
jgi:hypothetical protein